uniref:Uncharacterized protein n=1 Tax=Hucho hucho TaxID=62062 RepID=A0A4W5RBV4_9TELE
MDHLEETSFTLHWSKAEGMEKVPQRFLISNCIPGTDPLTAVTDDCHRTFSNLQPGTEYTVSVTTVLSNGEQSEPVSTSICTILPAPDQLTVDSVNTTSAAVSWNQPPGLDQTQHHYQISYRCPGTEPHITTTFSHNITLSDLKPGTEYSVTICTVLENGRQSQLVLTTLITVLPAPDQLTVDSVDTTSAAVSWSQPPGLDQTKHHYQISYRCPGTEPHITTTFSHNITLSDLKPGTEYSVTVCTVLENGRQSQLVSTNLTTVHFQWWKRPSRVAAVCILLAVILGWLDSYAERDPLQNSLNTRTTERDQLQTRLRFYEKPCLDGWWKFGTSCYYVSSTMETGRGGQKECRAMGADDVIINSREEQIFINGFKKNVWIGALKKDGFWQWVDKTQFNTTYWMEGEPNNMHDKCVEISQTASDPLKSWRAAPCTSNYWVCEKPFTP